MGSEKHQISVIDDNEAIREAFGMLLEMAGYNVSKFESGMTFFDGYKNLKTDCIILDLEMPIMSGLAVLDKLDKFDSNPPVIVVTGTPNQAMIDDANRETVACILSKPINPTELLTEVAKLFDAVRI